MPIVIEAGSDMASLCLFDPAALPPDYRQRPVRERGSILTTLIDREAALRILTGSDGSFHFHLYLDENPPENPGKLTLDRSIVNTAGTFCLTGEEDVRPADDKGFGLAAIPLLAGKYSVKIWRVPKSEETEGELIQKRAIAEVGPEAWANYTRRSTFSVIIVIGLMLGGVFCVLATLTRSGRGYFGWPGLAAIWLGWLALVQIIPRLMRSAEDEKLARILIEAQRGFPSYIIHLARA